MTSVIVLACLLMASPSLYAALTGTGDVDTALLHLALALLVSAIGGQLVRQIFTGYARPAAEVAGAEDNPARRRTDVPDTML